MTEALEPDPSYYSEGPETPPAGGPIVAEPRADAEMPDDPPTPAPELPSADGTD